MASRPSTFEAPLAETKAALETAQAAVDQLYARWAALEEKRTQSISAQQT
ncbi:MAG: hypothetical protein ACT4O4_12780 [Nitrospiraceae bacterium]